MRKIFAASVAVLVVFGSFLGAAAPAQADAPTRYIVSGTAEFPLLPDPEPSMPPCPYESCHTPGGWATLTTLGGQLVGEYPASVGYDGQFAIGEVKPGRYLLSVSLNIPLYDRYSTDWYYGDTPYRSQATVIEVNDHDVTGLELTPPKGGSVSGRLTNSSGAAVADTMAQAFLDDPTTGYQNRATVWAEVGADGTYLLDGLAPGRWVVQFYHDPDRSPSPFGVSYAGGDDLARARQIDIADGSAVTGADGILKPYSVTVAPDRISGADRFAVAVQASQRGFDPGVEQVYVANGLNWPDALSAGPAAAYHDSPLLLVTPTALPDAVRDEIERLAPGEIVIVGGPNSVGPDVERELAAIAPVERIGGADRYEVSRKLNLAAFGTTIDSRYVLAASGRNFPDALSSGAVAAAEFSPVLLIDGLAPQLDAETRIYLFNAQIWGVTAVGGPASITDYLMNELGDFSRYDGPASRVGGDDRFAVNRNLNSYDGYFTPPTVSNTAYLVSGLTFPDALSATTLAAEKDARVFLSAQNCVPQATLDTIRGLHVERIVLVGGPNTLGSGVAKLTPC